MLITKYIHSCILLEEDGHKLLFDPGKFSFIEGRVKPEDFGDVSTIVISHEHPDHLDVDALKQIIGQNQPTANNSDGGWFAYSPKSASAMNQRYTWVIGNEQVAVRLQKEGITVTTLSADPQQIGGFTIQAVPAQHEAILAGELPQNTAHVVNGRILNPGDSFKPSLEAFAGIELLLLPVMAPWLTELAVLDFARRLRPQQVLPIHDGYAKDFFLKQRYEAYALVFDKNNIRFHPLMEPGASITL